MSKGFIAAVVLLTGLLATGSAEARERECRFVPGANFPGSGEVLGNRRCTVSASEPLTLTLVAGALTGVAWLRRRQRR